MTASAPKIYYFFGDDQIAFEEKVAEMHEKLGDDTAVSLNSKTFEARNLEIAAFEEAALAAPFLASRRLVLIDHMEAFPRSDKKLDALLARLHTLPATTALVLIEHVQLNRPRDRQNWQKKSPILKWCQVNGEIALAQACFVPQGSAFVGWIQQRVEDQGGQIDAKAAQLLAEWVAGDKPTADQEVGKLLGYVNRERPISAEDVELLTPYYTQSDVFAAVDAIGARQPEKALRLMHELLETENSRYVFTMIVRQFRLLIQAREALDERKAPQEVLSVHPFVADKVAGQARNFNLGQLEAIYQELLRVEIDSKSGRSDLNAELDNLIIRTTASQ